MNVIKNDAAEFAIPRVAANLNVATSSGTYILVRFALMLLGQNPCFACEICT